MLLCMLISCSGGFHFFPGVKNMVVGLCDSFDIAFSGKPEMLFHRSSGSIAPESMQMKAEFSIFCPESTFLYNPINLLGLI